MVSPLIEAGLIFGSNRFALGAALQLPSLAAAELERKGKFTKEAQAEAERFALNDYLTTLAGAPPKGDAARSFYAKLAQVSGLPEDVVTKSRGFIRDAYVKHLRSSEGKIVSALRCDLRGRRSLSGPGNFARSRSDARRPDPRLRQRLFELRARRARLQDRDDLHPARRRHQRQMGVGRALGPQPGERRPTTCGSCWR